MPPPPLEKTVTQSKHLLRRMTASRVRRRSQLGRERLRQAWATSGPCSGNDSNALLIYWGRYNQHIVKALREARAMCTITVPLVSALHGRHTFSQSHLILLISFTSSPPLPLDRQPRPRYSVSGQRSPCRTPQSSEAPQNTCKRMHVNGRASSVLHNLRRVKTVQHTMRTVHHRGEQPQGPSLPSERDMPPSMIETSCRS
jgi:hypothetical protein